MENAMKNNESSTSIMLSALSIDSGINYANELETIFCNLEEHPEEFNKKTASRLAAISRAIKGCLYDYYENSGHKNFSYEDVQSVKENKAELQSDDCLSYAA